MNEPFDFDPFARDDSAISNPTDLACDQSDSADGMTVHGLLATLLPGEEARVQERVGRAIATIRQENKRFQLNFRRRLAWIGGSVSIAAALALAVLYVPSSSNSNAFAALQSIRSSSKQSERTYSVRMEIEPAAFDSATKQDRAQSAQRPQMQTRTGELVLGTGGRWTLSIFGMMPPRAILDALEKRNAADPQDGADRRSPRMKGVFGFDGTTYWAIDPTGTIRTAASLRELRTPMISMIESGWAQSDDEIEPLTLESMLDRLDRGYVITFEPSATNIAADGRPVTIVTAQRDSSFPKMRGPKNVKIIADAQNYDVLKAEWEWAEIAKPFANSSGGPALKEGGVSGEAPSKRQLPGKPIGKAPMTGMPVTKRIFLDLIDNPMGKSKRTSSSKGQSTTDAIDPLWFEPSFHVEAILNGQLPPNGTETLPTTR